MENLAFFAKGVLPLGINLAIIEYTPAPAAPLDRTVAEVRRSVRWLAEHLAEYGGDPNQLYVAGHSAGGHLTAMTMPGKVRYIGASSMHAWQFARALSVSERNGWTRFVSMQNLVNLLYREEEQEMLPLCAAEGIGVIPWSPQARGRLTRDWNYTSIRTETDDAHQRLFAKSAEADRKVVDRVAEVAAARGFPGPRWRGVAALQAGHYSSDRRRHQAAPSRRRSRIRERETVRGRDYLSGRAVCAACGGRFRLGAYRRRLVPQEFPLFRSVLIIAALFLAAGIALRGFPSAAESARSIPAVLDDPANPQTTSEIAVIAGGCFWGVQGVFQHVEGITGAVSGYAGGASNTAHYEMVGTSTTGHAESVQVTFDPRRISYGRILQIYFSVAHDPTQLNRQGPDVGTQYRSAIFPTNPEQTHIAEAYVVQLNQAHVFDAPVVTRIEPGREFYPAEDYHQDFLTRNPQYPYIVINDLPKIDNLKGLFPDLYRATPVLVATAAPRG